MPKLFILLSFFILNVSVNANETKTDNYNANTQSAVTGSQFELQQSVDQQYDIQQLIDARKFEVVLELANQGIQTDPDNAYYYYLAAQAHMGLKNYSQSVKMAGQSVTKDPTTSDYFRLLADTEVLKLLGAQNTSILRLPGLARRTKNNYQTAVRLDPNNIKAREGLGLLYMMAPRIVGGSLRKAKFQADEIAKLDKNKAYPFYIGINKKRNNWEQALVLANEWEAKKPTLWKVQEEKFRIYFEQKKYSEAADILLTWLDTNPNETNAQYLLGLLASDSNQFLEQGRDALIQYLTETPALTQPGHEWSYFRLATIYAKLDQTELASKNAKLAKAASPENAKVIALATEFLNQLKRT